MEIIASASDITEIDKQPMRDNGKYNVIFFVFFVLIGSFFILNLIVGVIIESFQKLRKKVTGKDDDDDDAAGGGCTIFCSLNSPLSHN